MTEMEEFFKETGSRGGKRSLETMTPEERKERARLAGVASAAARAKKAAAVSAKVRSAKARAKKRG